MTRRFEDLLDAAVILGDFTVGSWAIFLLNYSVLKLGTPRASNSNPVSASKPGSVRHLIFSRHAPERSDGL